LCGKRGGTGQEAFQTPCADARKSDIIRGKHRRWQLPGRRGRRKRVTIRAKGKATENWKTRERSWGAKLRETSARGEKKITKEGSEPSIKGVLIKHGGATNRFGKRGRQKSALG